MASVHGERTKQYIKPTDSDYVKLAKQGGDRDLLVSHSVEKSDEARPYAKCEWFDHIHNDAEDARNRRTNSQVQDQKSVTDKGNETAGNARLEGSKIKEKYTRGGIPFYTDSGFSGKGANPRSQPAKEDEEQASNSRLEGSKIKEKYTGGGVPYHTDNMSVWERKKVVPATPDQRVAPRERNPIY